MKNPLCLLVITLLCFGLAWPAAQAQRTITGAVTSNEGEPLIGVNITVTGTGRGTVTDIDGQYSLEVQTGDRLVFSYTGYATVEVVVAAGKDVFDVVLNPGVALSEVVVTALGISREKKALGYAVQEVNAAQIIESKQPNLVNALQGQVAGVQITSAGGGPGEAARIIIRGVNSLDPSANNQPLFVIDGVAIDNSTFTVGGGALRNVSNRVADLNPEDIESVNVLKGGAATALYGVRAANGAVIITTKRGEAGRLSVDLSSTYGMEEVNKFPETQRLYTQGYRGEYDPNSFWPTWGPTIAEARAQDPTHPPTIFNNFENAYQEGWQWRHSLSITGGTEQASFRASISRLDQEGVLPNSTYENTSFRFNADVRASDKFTVGGGINFVNSGGDRVLAESFNERLIYWAPRVDVTDYQFPNGTMKGYRNNGTIGNNPIYGTATNKFTDDVDRFIGNLNFNYQLFPWMSLNYRVGMDQYTDFRFHRAPGPRGVANENVFEDNGLGFTNETRIRKRDITSTLSANFDFNITEKLDATLLLGHDVFDQSYNRVTTNGRELAIWNLFSLNNASVITTDSYKETYRLMGLYGDLSLGYDNTFFLSITGRNDWSSALPVESRSFFYPSVSLGYVFSEMLTLPAWWTFGKLRASYAGIGKDTQPYRTNTVYASASGFPIEGVTGWTRDDQKGAIDLKPERTNTIELGADLRFFRNRLGIDFTWYKANSKDQIIPVPASPTTGFSTFILNAGEIENRGVELVVNATPVETRNFSWDVTVNFTSNDNEVVAIKDGIESIFLGSHFGYAGSTASLRLIVGQPYGNLYGTSYRRYYENPADDDRLTVDNDRPLLIGANGFPVVDLTNQRILGNSTPAWFGSIINSFRWKGLTLSFLFDTRQGVQKYNQLDNFMAAFGISPYTLNRDQTVVFDGVTADGSPNTKQVYYGQGVGPDGVNYGDGYYRLVYRRSTENFIEDADWIRLRNLSLGYELPQSLLSKTPFRRMGVTLTGYNLWLDTPFSGFDPEGNRGNGNGDDGFGGFTYPGVRRYSVTLNVGF